MIKPLIVFAGTVGSGKTTQLRLLASEFRRRGLKARSTSIKTNHLFGHLLSFILVRVLIKDRRPAYPIRDLIEKKRAIFSRIFRLWLALDLLSISFRFLLTIFLFTRVGYIMLVEEYIPATISDYIYLTRAVGLPLKTSSFVIRFLSKLIHAGGPVQVVFLDGQVDTLKSRWMNRMSLEERSDYLKMQRTTLFSLSRMFSSKSVLYINTTNQNLLETHKLIVSHFEDNTIGPTSNS